MTAIQEAIGIKHSTMVVRNLLRLSLSTIAYLRNFFPDECFVEKRASGGLRLRSLVGATQESRVMIEWLEKGVFDAFDHQYLRVFTLCVFQGCEEREGSLLEAYEFHIVYARDGSDGAMLTSKTTTASTTACTTSSSRICVSKEDAILEMGRTMRRLITLTESLPPLPDNHLITMRLQYYEAYTPREYEPPYFTQASPEQYRMMREADEEEVSHSPDCASNVAAGGATTSHALSTFETTFHGVRITFRGRRETAVDGSSRGPTTYANNITVAQQQQQQQQQQQLVFNRGTSVPNTHPNPHQPSTTSDVVNRLHRPDVNHAAVDLGIDKDTSNSGVISSSNPTSASFLETFLRVVQRAWQLQQEASSLHPPNEDNRKHRVPRRWMLDCLQQNIDVRSPPSLSHRIHIPTLLDCLVYVLLRYPCVTVGETLNTLQQVESDLKVMASESDDEAEEMLAAPDASGSGRSVFSTTEKSQDNDTQRTYLSMVSGGATFPDSTEHHRAAAAAAPPWQRRRSQSTRLRTPDTVKDRVVVALKFLLQEGVVEFTGRSCATSSLLLSKALTAVTRETVLTVALLGGGPAADTKNASRSVRLEKKDTARIWKECVGVLVAPPPAWMAAQLNLSPALLQALNARQQEEDPQPINGTCEDAVRESSSLSRNSGAWAATSTTKPNQKATCKTKRLSVVAQPLERDASKRMRLT